MANGTKCHVFDDGGNFPDTFMTFENVQAFLRITAILVVEAVWDLDALNQEDAADPESELEGVRKVVDVICRRIEAVEKYLEQWRECEAFQNHIAEFDQFIKEARGEVAEMNEKIKEAEKRLKEAREASEASEVKLSDLAPEEWEDCKGMWVRVKELFGETFEGIILHFDETAARVHDPRNGTLSWRRPDHLILLPDHQRAFSPDGSPVKVDPGQWEKTHAMEEEFDRIKAEDDCATRVVAYGGLAVRELIAAAPDLAETIAGMRAEYAVQYLDPSGEWKFTYEDYDNRWQSSLAVQMVRATRDHTAEETRIVRRYVTDAETMEEE
ncbi:hypothetical protein BRL53_09070 [Corynebacterium ulcerans]|uniref:hypothetical protein n=1 Tax=Corynebacterium ulcerans TaxID=65058 RepID=UPI000C771766|nr:hypothetical protein [Corynebacterium ulcerans]PLV98771.1 hypothetical protein BRL53_09070 [Corynebacterium ulcerans]